jgi:hypothetical protein
MSGPRALMLGAAIFGLAGFASIVLTDMVLLNELPRFGQGTIHGLKFALEPVWLCSSVIPPAIFGAIAAWRFISGRMKRGGWINVAAWAWLSLAINPLIWVLVGMSFLVYGMVALHVFFAIGLLLNILARSVPSLRRTVQARRAVQS